MNAASHLLSHTVPGYGTSDGRCLPCSGISGGSFNISPCSSRSDYKILPNFKIIHLRCGSRGSTLSICNVDSGGKKRNPDYSRRIKQGGNSMNRNSRQNEERDDIDDEDSEFFPKNGQMVSGSFQHQATATPGRKEEEIVEIFKNIQARLRENAAYKDVKKVADSQESLDQKTVESLIETLRVSKEKQNNISGNRSGGGLDHWKENDQVLEDKAQKTSASTKQVKYFGKERVDQPKQNGAVVKDKSHISLGLEEMIDVLKNSKRASFSRPPSNFQRRSPVPPLKYKPIFSDSDEEATVGSARFTKINGKREKTQFEPEPKPELDIEHELDLELEQEPEQLEEAESFLSDESGSEFVDLIDDEDSGMDEDAIKEDDDEDENGDKDLCGMETQEARAHVELHLMKVVELRALAKSRGLKGISRLKKPELVELLAGSGGSI